MLCQHTICAHDLHHAVSRQWTPSSQQTTAIAELTHSTRYSLASFPRGAGNCALRQTL